MVIVRGAFDEYLAPGARGVFIDEYVELPAEYPEYFTVETSQRAYEDELVATGLGIATSMEEGEEIPMDRPHFRGRVRYIHGLYGLGYEVSREAVEDDLYGAITRPSSTNLARSMREAEEVSAWSIINGFFSSTKAYDGVPIISTAHPGVAGLSQANRPAADTDLSYAAIQASLERFFNLKTDRGMRISMAPSRLLVSTSGIWQARELLGGPLKPGVNENTISTLSDQGLTPGFSRYLTDPDAWYLMAPKGMQLLKFFWRRKPTFENGFEGRTGISWFGVTARWSAGIRDWRGIDGSSGA